MSTETITAEATETTITVDQAEAAYKRMGHRFSDLRERLQHASTPADVLAVKKDLEGATFDMKAANVVLLDAKIAEAKQKLADAQAEKESLEGEAASAIEEFSLAQELLNRKHQAKQSIIMRMSFNRINADGQRSIVSTLEKERADLMAGLIEGATK